jgi:ATP-dependent DNA helicase RecQ
LAKLDAMARFAEGEACRHQAIAAYFNDTIEACGTVCDNCTMPASEKIDITTAARKLLSAIWRTDQRFGLHYVVDVLRGSRDQRVLKNGHDALSVYGIGEEYSRAQWLTIGDRLLEMGAVEVGEYKVYALTPTGVEILKGSRAVELREDRLSIQKIKAKKPPVDFGEYDMEAFEALRTLRMEIATANSIPPYVVFSDKTLQEMSIKRPENKSEFLEINGVGEVKYARYGEEFLALLHRIGNKKQVRGTCDT